MDTKGILQNGRQEKNNVQEELVRVKAYRIGWFSVSGVMIFVLIIRIMFAEPTYDIFMILMAHLGATSFYHYYNMRDRKIYLFTGIMGVVLLLLFLIYFSRQYGVY